MDGRSGGTGDGDGRGAGVGGAPCSWLARSVAGLLAGALAACAPGPPPEPPSPVSVEEPKPRSDPIDRVEVEPAAPLEAPLAAPQPPWLLPAVGWSPAAPREGTAVAVRVTSPPGGRRARAVEGELAGRPVRFARLEDGWFGLGALPIGSAGSQLLSLRFRVGPDSTVELLEPFRVGGREYPATHLRVAPRYADPPPATLERIRRERERIRATLATVTPEWKVDAPFILPRPRRVTSPFGQRRVFNGRLRSRHLGLDLRGGDGDPVLAAAGGRVTLTGDFYYQGGAVYVDHGLGVYTGYFHLSRIDVEEGEEVVRGQLLGGVGSTGRVTGPHLHWSLYVAEENLDPSSLLELDLPPLPGRGTASRVPTRRNRSRPPLPGRGTASVAPADAWWAWAAAWPSLPSGE